MTCTNECGCPCETCYARRWADISEEVSKKALLEEQAMSNVVNLEGYRRRKQCQAV